MSRLDRVLVRVHNLLAEGGVIIAVVLIVFLTVLFAFTQSPR